jgi:hypothetical protein
LAFRPQSRLNRPLNGPLQATLVELELSHWWITFPRAGRSPDFGESLVTLQSRAGRRWARQVLDTAAALSDSDGR